MKIKGVDLLDEQLVFGLTRKNLLPTRDKVDLELFGDWVCVTCLAEGDRKGQCIMIHGGRCKNITPFEAPKRNK